jgi:quinol monooxygenase YgiN
MIVTLSTMRARAGAANILRDALSAVTAPSLEEPGCASYRVSRSLEDPALFYVIAEWASPDALDEHVGLPHADVFRAQTADALAEPFTTVVLELVA